MHEIFEAIESGDLVRVKSIVQNDASILNVKDKYGNIPLMAAIHDMDRKYEIIEYLVESGSDVNYQTKEGYTPLHANVDVDADDPSCFGELPYKIAHLLKDYGANTELRNHYGWTPLMRAALEGVDDEFKALLDIGAKFDVYYPAYSMPVFTRGLSLAEVILPQPEKPKILMN
ncbi:MAG: ankyrin repeat domain-containing protein [Planctomycetota bacterium]|jgi:ankyrin repeat protein